MVWNPNGELRIYGISFDELRCAAEPIHHGE
jgi:hypothetical protein